MHPFDLPAISSIAATIQLAIAPVFLLAGLGAILNVVAGRLARIVDRSRTLEERHRETTGDEHARVVWELRLLDRRIELASRSVALCVASAVMVCLLVALLFVTVLIGLPYRAAVAVCFVLAMALLIGGLITFLIETRLARKAVRIRAELLEQDDRRRDSRFPWIG